MLKQHRNVFIKIIKNADLDPSSFDVEEHTTDNGQRVFCMRVRDTQLAFAVVHSQHSYREFGFRYTSFSPDFSMEGDERPELHIEEVYNIFVDWLAEHVKPYFDEQDTPDLWKQLEQQKTILPTADIDEDDTAPFSAEEVQQMRLCMAEFKLLFVKEFQPSADELRVIEARLTYLTEAIPRLNRLDWRSLAFSTLMSITVALSLDTERGKALFSLFKQVFSTVTKLLQ